MKRRKIWNQELIRKVLQEIRPERGRLSLAMALVTAAKLCLAFAPLVSRGLIDWISAGKPPDQTFLGQCLLLGCLFLVGYGMDAMMGVALVKTSSGCVQRLRDKATRKMNVLPLRYMDGHPAGDLQSRLTSDMTVFSEMLNTAVSVVSQLVLFVTVITLMFLTDWRLSLAYLLIYPAGMMASSRIVRKTGKQAKQRAQALGRLSSKVTDTCDAHAVIRAYGCGEQMTRDFDVILEEYDRTNRGAKFLTALIPVSFSAVNNISYVVCCILSGYLVLQGQLTLGGFQAFLLFGNMMISPVVTISAGIGSLQQGGASAERIYELLDETEEPDEGNKPGPEMDKLAGGVGFEHVKFSYEEKHPLMRDVSFTVEPGMTVAIVGPSGAGKTTLVNLLMRFYETQGGKILLDGQDIFSLNRRRLREAVSIVLQDSWIFDGTIRENIAYGRPDAAEDEMRRAAELVGCDRFIERMEKGYDTRVSEESAALSAGEKQLLSIARAALANRPILVLDEATSQVDTRTEYEITRAMEKLMEGKTCFVIAHRLFTIRNADLILYMEKGDVKETGTHEQLMARNGKYAAMFRAVAEET